MAKIRVYEFARDLNMTNRELLDRIRDLDVDVSSHMSSLDEDVVAMVKSSLFGEEKDDQLEEMRVRPTVIRRRKVVAPQCRTPDAHPRDAEEAGSEAADEAGVLPVKAATGKPPARAGTRIGPGRGGSAGAFGKRRRR
jgi:translation initiation factor IF-2